MRFVTYSSLTEFAAGPWFQHQLESCTPAPSEDPAQDELSAMQTALDSLAKWAQAVQAASPMQYMMAPVQLTSQGPPTASAPTPSPPHKQLLLIAEALSMPAELCDNNHATATAELTAVLGSHNKPLFQPLTALAAATAQIWSAAEHTVAATPQKQAEPAATPGHASSSQNATHATMSMPATAMVTNPLGTATALPPGAVATADAEQLKPLLFWLCHLTTATHKFFMAQAVSPSSTSKSKKAAASAVPSPQKHKWLQQVLPDLLKGMLACSQLLAGTRSACTAATIQTPAAADATATVTSTAAAMLAGHQFPPMQCNCNCTWLGSKDQAAVDKLLLSTCLSLLRTKTPKPSSKRTNSSSNASQNGALQLECLHLCAAITGCHLLIRHRQLQQSQQRGSSNDSGQQLAREMCGMLQDQQQSPQIKDLLSLALAGLQCNSSTAQQGTQLLCLLAETVFAQWQPQKQKDGSISTSAAAAAAAAASAAAKDADSVLVMLDILLTVLSIAPNKSAAAAAAGSRDGSSSSQHQRQQMPLLAAAMLPMLVPTALMSNPGARKLWLGLASVATVAAPTAAAVNALLSLGNDQAAVLDTEAPAESTAAVAAAFAAVEAHTAGMEALAAAARCDKDANVRTKALALLADAVPLLWQNTSFIALLEQQQQRVGTATATAAVQTNARATHLMICSANSKQKLNSCFGSMTAALQSQLLCSSKSSRTKALQLLQLLLSNPAMLNLNTSAGVENCEVFNPEHGLVQHCTEQRQQQLVLDTFDCLSVIMSAREDSALHCPASMAAAEQLLPIMARLLQPQQALQLALNSSAAPAAAQQLLMGLSHCSSTALYALLKQQLLALGSNDSSSAAAAAGGEEHAKQRLKQQPKQQMLRKLQQLLAAGGCCSEPLRQHAFVAVCGALNAAVDTTNGAAAVTEADSAPMAHHHHHQQQQQEEAVWQLLVAVELLELAGGCTSPDQCKDFKAELAILADAVDLCCYCIQTSAAAVPAEGTPQMAAEAARADAPSSSAAAATVAAVATSAQADVVAAEPAMSPNAAVTDPSTDNLPEAGKHTNKQQQECNNPSFELHPCLSTCAELLNSLLRIINKAATAAATSDTDSSHSKSTLQLQQQDATTHVAADRQQLLAGVGATLLHHADLVISLTACCNVASQIPVETLDLYLQVLCACNRDRQLLLHDLLLAWHKELAAALPASSNTNITSSDTAAAVPPQSQIAEDQIAEPRAATDAVAVARDTRLVAFLLLLQHLAGLYEIEQQWFKQRLTATLRTAANTAHEAPSSPSQIFSSQAEIAAAAAAAGNVRSVACKRSADGALRSRELDIYQQQHQQSCSPELPNNTPALNPNSAGAESSAKPQSNAGFDYMLGEEERQCVEASTIKFMADLLAETAPACYLPLLRQLLTAADAPAHIKVLALQALQPLLLCSADLSHHHSTLLAALLADPCTPAPLQLQAVATSGLIIAARPAQSQQLIAQIEQLLLRRLTSAHTTVAAVTLLDADTAGAAVTQDASARSIQQLEEAAGTRTAAGGRDADVLCCAAGVYAGLLLQEKLLLAANSWAVVAAGLLAQDTLHAVCLIMQQLLRCLLSQQHLSRIKAALGLLLNCPVATNNNPNRHTTNASSSNGISPGSSSNNSSSSGALQLVQEHLLGLLQAKDLASEELQLPLLAALSQAAQAGWQNEGVMPLVVLLGQCSPTTRCLDALLSILQAYKNSISMHCSARMLAHMQTYVGNYKPNSRAAAAAAATEANGTATEADVEAAAVVSVRQQKGRRQNKPAGQKRAADAAQLSSGMSGVAASTHAKLLQLLSEVKAATEATDAAASRGNSGKRSGLKRRAAGAARGSSVEQTEVRPEELQQLALERRQQLQQYREAKLA